MTKKIACLIGCVLLGTSLLACAEKPKQEEAVKPEKLTLSANEDLRFDAVVYGPEEDAYKVYTADLQHVDSVGREEFVDLFFEDVSGNLKVNEDEKVFFVNVADGAEGGYGELASRTYAYVNDGSRYGYLLGSLDPEESPYEYKIEYSVEDAGELEGTSREEAKEVVREVSESLGLTLEDEPFFLRAFTKKDLETLSQEEGSMLHDMRELSPDEEAGLWKDGDDAYLMMWNQKFEGVTVASGAYRDWHDTHRSIALEDFEQGSSVFAVVDCSGKIRAFDTTHVFRKTGEKAAIDIQILPKDLPDILEEHYKAQNFNKNLVVTDITFCYVPRLTGTAPEVFDMIPGYQILVKGDLPDGYEVIYVDAVTGDII